MVTSEYELNCYITHFSPPVGNRRKWFRSFILLRLNLNYIRSWIRLLRHGTRGYQPWKKDVMTDIRNRDGQNRYGYLSQVLYELNNIDLKSIRINIISNSREVEEVLTRFDQLKNIKFHFFEKYSKMNTIHNSPWEYNDSESPWLLTWEHKKIMLQDLEVATDNSLFLYLENDMKFTQQNLEYWLESRKDLKDTKLVPSFVRVEHSQIRDKLLALDYIGRSASKISEISTYMSNRYLYAQLANPYCAIFVLDLDLAIEYSRSKAIEEKSSRELSEWDIGARAAMGIQFVDVPKNFSSRFVVPIKKDGNYYQVLSSSLIHHLPNLYSRVKSIEKELLPIDKIISE
jgi:hypothetical protein